jgi:hypothetical protein
MRAELTAAIDRHLASLISDRARRRSPILGLLPACWLEPLVAPRVRRLRIKLMAGALGLSLILVGATLYVAVAASGG